MVFIGIDPGAEGAIAFITNSVTDVYDFNDQEVLKRLNLISCQRSLDGLRIKALIERVHAMPGQGVSSMFKFGVNFGIWQGRLEAFGIPFDFVTPQKWQKVIYGSAPKAFKTVKGEKKVDSKAMSLTMARNLFPSIRGRLERQKDNGRADALLIAEYCRLMERGLV